jgi:adenylate cyclase
LAVISSPSAPAHTKYETDSATDGPGVHASVHCGVAIARDGDYFGSAVNLAARLLAAAGRDELVATSPVVHATDTSFVWDQAGAVRIRGFAEPIEVFRLGPRGGPPDVS